jgi:hypothetical protein
VSLDWKSEESVERADGTKTVQRPDTDQDRTAKYRLWHRSFGSDVYVNDLDQIEWRMVDGNVVPVAHIELSRVDGNRDVPFTYLEAAWDRFTLRDPQSKVSTIVAERVGIPAYFVLFRWDLTEFWIREFYIPEREPVDKWYEEISAVDYRNWIVGLVDA